MDGPANALPQTSALPQRNTQPLPKPNTPGSPPPELGVGGKKIPPAERNKQAPPQPKDEEAAVTLSTPGGATAEPTPGVLKTLGLKPTDPENPDVCSCKPDSGWDPEAGDCVKGRNTSEF